MKKPVLQVVAMAVGKSPIDALLDKVDMCCVICGKPRSIGCDCWEECSCGWTARKGEPCGNPKSKRCSTKIKYGKKRKPKA